MLEFRQDWTLLEESGTSQPAEKAGHSESKPELQRTVEYKEQLDIKLSQYCVDVIKRYIILQSSESTPEKSAQTLEQLLTGLPSFIYELQVLRGDSLPKVFKAVNSNSEEMKKVKDAIEMTRTQYPQHQKAIDHQTETELRSTNNRQPLDYVGLGQQVEDRNLIKNRITHDLNTKFTAHIHKLGIDLFRALLKEEV